MQFIDDQFAAGTRLMHQADLAAQFRRAEGRRAQRRRAVGQRHPRHDRHGTFQALLPGGGATLASFSAYSLEKKVSRHPQKFGTGLPEGVAAPEAANNAAAQSSFIPLLTLGIPSNNMMAMMLSALMINGITPGPSVLTNQPEIFWGLVASMWIGNLLLVIINLPLIGLWVRMLTVPYRLLYPAILLFCCIGVYSMNNRIFEVVLAAGFGLLGYLIRKAKWEPGPLVLGFVLGREPGSARSHGCAPSAAPALRPCAIDTHRSLSKMRRPAPLFQRARRSARSYPASQPRRVGERRLLSASGQMTG